MKILLKTIMAGPDGVRQPGVHDVDDDQAAALIEAGAAEPHGGAPPETADAPPQGERATTRGRAAGR